MKSNEREFILARNLDAVLTNVHYLSTYIFLCTVHKIRRVGSGILGTLGNMRTCTHSILKCKQKLTQFLCIRKKVHPILVLSLLIVVNDNKIF
jgi:hypothetical protein